MENRVARATRADGKTLMRVAQLAAAGYTGAGVTVAVLDTGVDHNHTELSPGGSDTTAKTIKGADVIDGDSDPMDGEGQGTAVAGIIAGTSGGVAPAARIYAGRILDNEGSGSSSQILAGINDAVSRVSGGNPFNIKVANLSLGMRRGPRIALAGKSIVVTAIGGRQGKGRDGDLQAWHSIDGGVTWQGPVNVNDAADSAREGLHGMAAGQCRSS